MAVPSQGQGLTLVLLSTGLFHSLLSAWLIGASEVFHPGGIDQSGVNTL